MKTIGDLLNSSVKEQEEFTSEVKEAAKLLFDSLPEETDVENILEEIRR